MEKKIYNGIIKLDIISEIDFGGMTSSKIKKHIRLVSRKIIKNHFMKFNIDEIELCVAIIDNKAIKKLNKDFRKKNKITNVLSFSNNDIKNINLQDIDMKYLMLGDVVISYETIVKEAINQKKNIIDHLTHILVHGILHLLGYDHENDQDAKIMQFEEEEILSGFGISSPYVN